MNCRVPGCENSVPPIFPICGEHFEQLPRELADRLFAAKHEGSSDVESIIAECLLVLK